MIENKGFSIEDDEDDKFNYLKKNYKGKKYKIHDNGELTYFDNKKYYFQKFGNFKDELTADKIHNYRDIFS